MALDTNDRSRRVFPISAKLGKFTRGISMSLHWFNRVWPQGRWIKGVPVFNQLLCRIYRSSPFEFDGTGDAFVQGQVAGQVMQYRDLPVLFVVSTAEQLVQYVAINHPLMVPASLRAPSSRKITAL